MSSDEHKSSSDHAMGTRHEAAGASAPVFVAAPYGVIVASQEWTIVFTSSAVDRTFAYAPGELIGQPVVRLLPGISDFEQGSWQDFSNGAHGRRTGIGRVIDGVRKDGTTTPLEI